MFFAVLCFIYSDVVTLLSIIIDVFALNKTYFLFHVFVLLKIVSTPLFNFIYFFQFLSFFPISSWFWLWNTFLLPNQLFLGYHSEEPCWWYSFTFCQTFNSTLLIILFEEFWRWPPPLDFVSLRTQMSISFLLFWY